MPLPNHLPKVKLEFFDEMHVEKGLLPVKGRTSEKFCDHIVKSPFNDSSTGGSGIRDAGSGR